MKKIVPILFLIALNIYGCVSTPEVKLEHRYKAESAPTQKQILVYFYRGYNQGYTGYAPYIFINKKAYSVLPHKGYTFAYLTPGNYVFEMRDSVEYKSELRAGVNENLKPGQTYYIKYVITKEVTQGEIMFGITGPAGLVMDSAMGYKNTPDEMYFEESSIAERYIVNNYYLKPTK